jgi:hypothetical protein
VGHYLQVPDEHFQLAVNQPAALHQDATKRSNALRHPHGEVPACGSVAASYSNLGQDEAERGTLSNVVEGECSPRGCGSAIHTRWGRAGVRHSLEGTSGGAAQLAVAIREFGAPWRRFPAVSCRGAEVRGLDDDLSYLT